MSRQTLIHPAILLALVAVAAGEVRLPNVFSDHMVVQRDKAIKVWGWGEKGDTVTVEFAGQKKSAKVAPLLRVVEGRQAQ